MALLDIVISNPRQGDNAFGAQATAETSQIEIHNFHFCEPIWAIPARWLTVCFVQSRKTFIHSRSEVEEEICPGWVFFTGGDASREDMANVKRKSPHNTENSMIVCTAMC